jgi:hypothetical protein
VPVVDLLASKRAKSKPVGDDAALDGCAPGRFVIDRRVSDHEGAIGIDADAGHHRQERIGARLSRIDAIAADHALKQIANPEGRQEPLRRNGRLVGQHSKSGPRADGLQRVDDALVRTRVVDEAGVVDLEESRERVRRVRDTCRIERPLHEQRRTLADHGADRVLRKRCSAELDDQLVGRISEVAA